MPAQPSDEWTFLRPEEFADDDAVERAEAASDASAEETAVHELEVDESQVGSNELDPGETLIVLALTDDPPVGYFDDEEPEPGPVRPAVESEQEPGLDDILVSQHYSFDRDGQ